MKDIFIWNETQNTFQLLLVSEKVLLENGVVFETIVDNFNCTPLTQSHAIIAILSKQLPMLNVNVTCFPSHRASIS